MRAVDDQRLAIVGSSMGGNKALVAGADSTEVDAVVAISPGLAFDSAPLWLSSGTNVLKNFVGQPVLLISSKGDTFSLHGSINL
jgi:dienelactone hydrolase